MLTVDGAPSASRFLLKLSSGLVLALAAAAPADAQVSMTISIASDYRLRGYSLTDGKPALSAGVSYDDPSGLYLSLSSLTKLGGDTRFLGIIGDAGYARRLGHNVTFDAGVLRSQVRAASSDRPAFEYSEVYAGAYVGPVSGRIYYSPDYGAGRRSALYGELGAGLEPLADWRLGAHLGLLRYLGSSAYVRSGAMRGDWQVSVARQLGRITLYGALSGGGPRGYDTYAHRRKAALTIGASVGF